MKRYVFSKAALILVCRLEPHFVLLYKIYTEITFIHDEYLEVTAKSERVCFCHDSFICTSTSLFVCLGFLFCFPSNVRAVAHTVDDLFLRAL